MLSTSKNVLFPGHNHILTTGTGEVASMVVAWCIVLVAIYTQVHLAVIVIIYWSYQNVFTVVLGQ